LEANVVELRQEVFEKDAWKIIEWLEDEEVTRYLNEMENVGRSIKQVIYRINLPILTHLFNQNGSFFMIIYKGESIGYLKLVPKGKAVEMVIIIGDKGKWGKGLGPKAIFQGLKHAFFNLRVDEVVAKIHFDNHRSKRAFEKAGFTEEKKLNVETKYSITMDEFLKLA